MARSRSALSLWTLALLALAAGCGRSFSYGPKRPPCVFDTDCPQGLHCVDQVCIDLTRIDAGPSNLKRFGEPCAKGSECLSGFCLGGPRGAFCTVPCQGACPDVLVCKAVPRFDVCPAHPDGGPIPFPDGGPCPPDGGFPPIGLCAVPQPLLCEPCTQDLDCGASGADKCLGTDGGFCGLDCTYRDCPKGYECNGERQCVPAQGSCDCTAATQGFTKGCGLTDSAGTCYGAQTCGPTGFGACSAREAAPEVCNGVDDNCNGLVDDGISPKACSDTANGHTCTGTAVCLGDAGWSCNARTPTPEVCNYVDDDCDQVVDNGFVDDAGRYVTRADCGGCGNDCDTLVPNATATDCVLRSGNPTCVATACDAGFFLFDGGQCLLLPDTLCHECSVDSDCVGPGSLCLSFAGGERSCGRDCGPNSPYPPCPSGYQCAPVDGGAQCVPLTGTCQCTTAVLGAQRACSFSTCRGFQFCLSDAGDNAWTSCDVKDFNPEICDGIDNDCDGVSDEGFLDPATGKYDLDVHDCGSCGNDCTKYWSPTVQHATGICDGGPAVPVCQMNCVTETDGGVTYEWVHVPGNPFNGCECERLLGNTTVDAPDLGPPYVDENCDGVDGVIADALFVRAGAPGNGDGSLAQPFATLAQAVAAFPSSGKQYILVAEGTYPENVVLFPGLQLYGAYAADFRSRDTTLHTSVILGQPPAAGTSGALAAIHAENISAGGPTTVVSGFTLRGYDVTTSTPDDRDGLASYAVYIKDSGPSLVLTNNEIAPGRGGAGGRGSTGAQGFGAQLSSALNASPGQNQQRNFGPCPVGLQIAGGTGGANPSCPSANGNPGGGVVCPVYNWSVTPHQGNEAVYTSAANGDGLGGYDWSFDTQSTSSCNHVTESGFPSNIQTHDGHDGQIGADGTSGQVGSGAAVIARTGSIASGQWVPSPLAATAGGSGSNASGGGGGGAGGGTLYFPSGGCPEYESGSTGGGGGAGGCGGSGGNPGRAGGASIGVIAIFTSPTSAGQLPRLSNNDIARNFGGQGGAGGFGGAGGNGGQGAFGGVPTTWSGSTGGTGGVGGNGGPGGGGGGGAGGPSFGILAVNADPSSWTSANTFPTGSANTGGTGGAGGSSAGSAAGTAGAAGASADVISLQSCSAGCPAATTCDPNGVCVPN